MKLIRTIALAVALLISLSVPAIAAAADTSNFVGYVACGWRTKAQPATTCSKSGRIGAFFKSKSATVHFRTCVTFPNGQRLCTHKSTAKQGIYYVNHLTTGTKGTLTVHWRSGGVVVAKYTIQVA